MKSVFFSLFILLLLSCTSLAQVNSNIIPAPLNYKAGAGAFQLKPGTPVSVPPIEGLSPINSVQSERVITDPFPASVLMRPASTPPKTKKAKSSIHTNLHGLAQFY